MNQPSKLLQLPSELRNKIYSLVLVHPTAIRIPFGQSESSKRALLRANHQVHDEAVGIYYGNNAFIADCGVWFLNADLICWLRSLGWKKRLLLKDIRLSLRQQKVFSPPGGVGDTHFFITALIKRLDGMGLLLPLDAVRVELGDEYLTYSELDARVRASGKKKKEHY
jgi:hypothetical protein